MKTHYRGHDIVVHAAGDWSAEIINASSGKTWSQRPSVALEDGPEACARRAKNLVDAYLALREG